MRARAKASQQTANQGMVRVLILCGGRSAEHDVSFMSTRSILPNLDPSKYEISVIGIRRDGAIYPVRKMLKKLDLGQQEGFQFPDGEHWISALWAARPQVVFPVLHGPFGEDGTVQGVFEVLGVPYVGAGVWGSAVGMNKIHGKKILLQEGLPVLPFVSMTHGQWRDSPESCLELVAANLNCPVFVKPSNLGSSVGISKSTTPDQLATHIEAAFQYDDFILVEQGIDAREIETSVLGNHAPRVSTAGEIVPSREFYDYEAKYLDEGSQLLIPAPLDDSQLQQVRELSLATFKALQLEGMARVDLLMDRNTGQFWVNEPNTIPGFTRISMYPKLWEASGLTYAELLDELFELALDRHQRRLRLSVER